MYSGVMVSSPKAIISAEVLVHGVPTPMFARADGRRFVVGTPGASYAIRVTNTTGRRIEVITTIDGRHVLDDEPGDSYRNKGFVIPGNSSYLFQGWRSSMDGTERFVFADPSMSVAERATGQTTNLGVIGFAVHQELYRDAFRDQGYSAVAVAAASPFSYGNEMMKGGTERGSLTPRGGSIGTGMGEHVHDPVQKVSFTRSGEAPDILAIGYDTEEVLDSMGLLRPADPNPFPATGQTGYSAPKFRGM